MNAITEAVHGVVLLALLAATLAGVVLAEGWFKVLAVWFPPYGWYLLIETLMQKFHLLQQCV